MYSVILDLLDQLWDRGDPDGYASYMTSHPLPDTPSHQVLIQIAYGDFQVSMYAGAAEARTVGVSAVVPSLDPARSRARSQLVLRHPGDHALSVRRFGGRDLGQRSG